MAVSPGEKLLLWDCFVRLCFLSAVARKNICLGLSVKLVLVKELTSIFFPRFIRLANFSSNWKTKHAGARRVKNSLLFRFRSSWRSWCNSVILAVVRSSFPPPLPRRKERGAELTFLCGCAVTAPTKSAFLVSGGEPPRHGAAESGKGERGAPERAPVRPPCAASPGMQGRTAARRRRDPRRRAPRVSTCTVLAKDGDQFKC